MPGNPEGIAVVKDSGRDILFALSDDGTMKIGNSECKKLKDSSLKVFRAYEIPLGSHFTESQSAPGALTTKEQERNQP
jgi:hypothetical protein